LGNQFYGLRGGAPPLPQKSNSRGGEYMTKRNNLTNRQFGKLTALFYAWSDEQGKSVWMFVCECGKIAFIRSNSVLTGNTESCGCIKVAKVTKWNIDRSTHGAIKTPEYWAYKGAKGRCTNPRNRSYSDYGGRGIQFRFSSFQEFLNAVGLRPSPEHSLDRIENDGHYENGNLRWATKEEQANNRRSYHITLTRRIAELEAKISMLTTSTNTDTIEVG
jgi:hypothetical protein